LWCVIGSGEKQNVIRFHKSKVGDKLVSQSLLDMAKISDSKE